MKELFESMNMLVQYCLEQNVKGGKQKSLNAIAIKLEGGKIMSRKIGWLVGERKLIEFHKQLVNSALITACDYLEFSAHFNGTKRCKQKIVWYGAKNELIYLFSFMMIERDIIPPWPDLSVLLCEHFLDKNGLALDSGVLRSSLEKGIRRPNRKTLIEGIISKTFTV